MPATQRYVARGDTGNKKKNPLNCVMIERRNAFTRFLATCKKKSATFAYLQLTLLLEVVLNGMKSSVFWVVTQRKVV